MSESLGTTQESFVPDRLMAGDDFITDSITLISGQNLTRGALLGKITLGAVTETHAGNTGNGVLTPDATTPVLANAQAGVYTAKCIAAATNSGTFLVFDPKGDQIGELVVGATFADQIKFVIADGATDFIVGDTFLITVAAGSGKYTLSLLAAVDGSQYPTAILARDTNAAAGDIVTTVYLAGEFNSNAITFGTGQTAANTKEALRLLDIYLKTAVAG